MKVRQLGAGFDRELVHQPLADRPIRVQRVGLPPGAVQRQDPLRLQVLAQRIRLR
jgi:hypothetical protein